MESHQAQGFQSLGESFARVAALTRQLDYILNSHNYKHSNNKHDANDLRRYLNLKADRAPLNFLDKKKNEQTTINNRQRQKVNYRQVRGYQCEEIQQLYKILTCNLAAHLNNPHLARDLVQPDRAGEAHPLHHHVNLLDEVIGLVEADHHRLSRVAHANLRHHIAGHQAIDHRVFVP